MLSRTVSVRPRVREKPSETLTVRLSGRRDQRCRSQSNNKKRWTHFLSIHLAMPGKIVIAQDINFRKQQSRGRPKKKGGVYPVTAVRLSPAEMITVRDP